MTWKESLGHAEQTLVEAGVADARSNAEYLAAHVLLLKHRSEVRANYRQEVSETDAAFFTELLARRANREPLQYILGEWEFFGLPIKVSNAALIPRPETETLVEQALSEIAKRPLGVSILDLGTGTGCIALAIAKNAPSTNVVGIDVSFDAVELAKENARLLGIPNVNFDIADILSDECLNSIPKIFDIIVSNTPYISQMDFEALEPELRKYEPRIALTDESNGLQFYKRIAESAPKLLVNDGLVLVEMGFGMSTAIEGIFHSAGYGRIRMVNDLAGIPRVFVATLTDQKQRKRGVSVLF